MQIFLLISMYKLAALFCLPRSNYKKFDFIDVYDEKRNAFNYRGHLPVIAHPPCRFWSRLHGLAKPRKNEYEYALWSFDIVNRYGGILEHPLYSKFWEYVDVNPYPVHQGWFGHKMRKETGLYFVNCEPQRLPLNLEYPGKYKSISFVSKQQAMGTPINFATWLISSVLSTELNWD